MQRYIFGRIIQVIISLLVVTLVVFLLVRLTGDPVEAMLPDTATTADYERLAHRMGVDKPLIVQYGIYLSGLLRGDFGDSTRALRPALSLIMERLPATLHLGAVGIAISVVFAVPIGIYAAVRRGTWLDAFARGFAVLGQSVPTFWLGILLIFVFAVVFDLLPSYGRYSPTSVILPAFTLGYFITAGIMRLTRSAMLDVLDSEYIKFARIKGVAESGVIWKHAFKNAAIPVLTFSMILFIHMIGGAVITETVFSWPGVGLLLIESVHNRDFATTQGIVILLSAAYLIGNLATDIVYAYLNPRIRYQRR